MDFIRESALNIGATIKIIMNSSTFVCFGSITTSAFKLPQFYIECFYFFSFHFLLSVLLFLFLLWWNKENDEMQHIKYSDDFIHSARRNSFHFICQCEHKVGSAIRIQFAHAMEKEQLHSSKSTDIECVCVCVWMKRAKKIKVNVLQPCALQLHIQQLRRWCIVKRHFILYFSATEHNLSNEQSSDSICSAKYTQIFSFSLCVFYSFKEFFTLFIDCIATGSQRRMQTCTIFTIVHCFEI